MGVIQIFHIILLPILIPLINCFVLDPICQSCLQIDSSLLSQYYKSQFNVNLTLFKLPGFSLSTIVVDFRHLKQFPLDSNNQRIFQLIFQIIDVSSQSKTIQNINDTIIGTNVYELQTTAQQTLMIFYIIKSDQKEFQYLLRQSISLNLSYSNNRIPNQDSSYLFVVTSQDNINLPHNKPDLANMKNFYLQNQLNPTSFVQTTASSESTMYWSTESQFVVPYFPYFSNCNGQSNMMHLMQMLQNQTDCQLVPLNETQWISEFSFWTSANADHCLIKRKCTIDGEVQKTEYPDWMTLTTGLSLFEISQKKIPWQQFSYDMNFLPEDLVKCQINSSKGSNTSDSYPLKVKLSMGYYQVSVTQKRIISCLIQYDLYVPATANFTYQLQISSYPLNHTYIMLNFGFKWYVYMIVFVIIGIIGNIQTLVMWFYHYFVAEERKEIKVMMYFRIIKEIMKGTTMALILQIFIIIIVCTIMNGKIFQTTFYDNTEANGSSSPRVLFDYILENPTKNYDSDDMQNLRSGRMGVGFIAIGVTIIFLNCKYFIGKEKPKQQEKDFQILGRIFKPLQWVRGKFLFSTFIYIILMYFFIYFAYSTLYSSNIWTFIVVMKVLQVILQEITKSIYDDILPGLPLKIITDITSYLNTISAADLYDFLFGSLIDVAITMIEKLYIFQIENMIVDKINEKTQEFNRFYLNLMNQQDGQEQEGNGNKPDGQYIDGAGQQNDDNQQVFIYRQSQQVQFFQEQIKQTYTFTRLDEQSKMISQCKESQQEKRLKKRYFQSLNRQYRYQRQILLNRQQLKAEQTGKKTRTDNKDGKNRQPLIDNVNQQQQQDEIDEEQRQQIMQQESQIFEILLDHMAMIYTFLVNPFAVFIIWIVYDQSQILTNYGISYNTVVLYILSALVIGVFSVINIIMIFHMLENYIGMSFEEQINDVLMRFDQRKTYWKADQSELNNRLKPQILGADHYCLSSQLFFILTVYVGGMILVIIGMAIIFQTNYNFFSDVATIPIVLFWILFLFIFMFVVKKCAILLNIWDYKKYKQGIVQDENGQGNNLYGLIDQKQLIKMMQQNSDFKTENIIFAPIEELPKFKKFFKTPKKIVSNLQQKQNEKAQYQQDQDKDKEKLEDDSQQIYYRQTPIKKKNPPKNPHLLLQQKHGHQQIILAQKHIETICKKLQPLFNKQIFRLEYSRGNSQFIKENIEKILPLVDYLPQLQQFKTILVSQKVSKQQQVTRNDHPKLTLTKRQQNTTNNKNMDPIITEMILQWLRVTEKQRQKRISNGLQTQSKVKKCSFCFQTWGLYYGKGSTCISCSMKINKLNKLKQQINTQQTNQIKSTKHSLLSSKESVIRKDKKKKSTKKKNKLNIITEEEDFDDQDNDSQQQSADDHNNSSDDQILNDNDSRKRHHL